MSTGKTVLTRLLFAWLAKGGDFEGGCIARGEVRSESILVQRTALGRRRRERICADAEEQWVTQNQLNLQRCSEQVSLVHD
jgi:hypothetical protein